MDNDLQNLQHNVELDDEEFGKYTLASIYNDMIGVYDMITQLNISTHFALLKVLGLTRMVFF